MTSHDPLRLLPHEHITGQRWPSAEERLGMLEEAVHVIRELWTGKLISHFGTHYTVDTARLYSLPPEPPPILMSGFGAKSTELAARIADGYISTMPDSAGLRRYREAGGGDRLTQVGLKVCWGPDEEQARKTARRLWPNDEIPGEAAQLLPLPRHFGQLSQLITEDKISTPCGPDPQAHVSAIRQYATAGFDEVYVGQVGPDQEGFFEFWAREVLPRLREG